MEYIISVLLLFVLLLVYFRIAYHFNIIDKPNFRSAHTEITLRGGGVIYPVSFLLFLVSQFLHHVSIIYPQNFLLFGTGLLIICTISFIDDIVDLSKKIRIFFHFVSVTLLMVFVNAFQLLPLWAVPLVYVLIIGILNAFNFMDGINGMSGLYSLITMGTLLYINYYQFEFTQNQFIVYPMMASAVFLFFNFRTKAKCFLGDVGSMGIAFWIVGLISLLIAKTDNFIYIMLLGVYGIEVILTLLERLLLKENIFEAHRRHLYQLLVNEKKISHLLVSSFYCIFQVLINLLITQLKSENLWAVFIIYILLISLYLSEKKKIETII